MSLSSSSSFNAIYSSKMESLAVDQSVQMWARFSDDLAGAMRRDWRLKTNLEGLAAGRHMGYLNSISQLGNHIHKHKLRP